MPWLNQKSINLGIKKYIAVIVLAVFCCINFGVVFGSNYGFLNANFAKADVADSTGNTLILTEINVVRADDLNNGCKNLGTQNSCQKAKWFELYNPTDVAQDLKDYYFDNNELYKTSLLVYPKTFFVISYLAESPVNFNALSRELTYKYNTFIFSKNHKKIEDISLFNTTKGDNFHSFQRCLGSDSWIQTQDSIYSIKFGINWFGTPGSDCKQTSSGTGVVVIPKNSSGNSTATINIGKVVEVDPNSFKSREFFDENSKVTQNSEPAQTPAQNLSDSSGQETKTLSNLSNTDTKETTQTQDSTSGNIQSETKVTTTKSLDDSIKPQNFGNSNTILVANKNNEAVTNIEPEVKNETLATVDLGSFIQLENNFEANNISQDIPQSNNSNALNNTQNSNLQDIEPLNNIYKPQNFTPKVLNGSFDNIRINNPARINYNLPLSTTSKELFSTIQYQLFSLILGSSIIFTASWLTLNLINKSRELLGLTPIQIVHH